MAELTFEFMGNDRPVAGMQDVWVGLESGVKVVACAVVIGFGRAHGANDRQVMHLFGNFGQQLGDLRIAGRGDRFVRSGRGGAGLHVPDVDRGRRAPHPQEDARLLIATEFCGVGNKTLRERKRRKRQRRGAREMAKKVAAVHALRRCEAIHGIAE